MSDSAKYERDTHARAQIYARLHGCLVYEGRSDGSNTHSQENGESQAGGAAVIFEPCPDHTRILLSTNGAVPLLSCSYMTETHAALKLLDDLSRRIGEKLLTQWLLESG